jgi:hypothetical protein
VLKTTFEISVVLDLISFIVTCKHFRQYFFINGYLVNKLEASAKKQPLRKYGMEESTSTVHCVGGIQSSDHIIYFNYVCS